MNGFRFRLDPVLELRERVERERAGEHARALEAQQSAERMRDTLALRRDGMRAELVRDHRAFDADALRAAYAHLDYLDRAIIAADGRVAAATAAAQAAHAQLVAAAKDRKVLETLRERRRESFLLDAALSDQRELDDQNARLAGRVDPFEGHVP